MKNQVLNSIYLVLIILSSALLSQDQFAPVLDTPENPKNDPELAIGIAILQDVQAPDKDDVGVAAYPDAKIFQTTKGQAGMLPTVRLLSADAIEDVTKFYKDELTDWQFKDQYGIQMFFKGDAQKAMFGQEPVVQIEDAEKFTDLMPEAKSVITIGYDSPGEEKNEG